MSIGPFVSCAALMCAISFPCGAESAPESSPLPSSPPFTEWHVAAADGTISAALGRWASTSGYQVAWQSTKDLPAFAVTYTGSFESAVEALMRDTQNGDYPLHACLYDNKVVRVLHATQACTR